MNTINLKDMPWVGLVGIFMQGVALTLCLIPIDFGFRLALVLGLLSVSLILNAVDDLNNRKKLIKHDIHIHIVMATLASFLCLIAALVISLLFNSGTVFAVISMGITIINILMQGLKIYSFQQDHHKASLNEAGNISPSHGLTDASFAPSITSPTAVTIPTTLITRQKQKPRIAVATDNTPLLNNADEQQIRYGT